MSVIDLGRRLGLCGLYPTGRIDRPLVAGF